MHKIFVIADLHFGHAKVAAARGFSSIDEHDSALVAAWNNVVTKNDTVYVLGDLFNIGPVRYLKGIKQLVMGNHDDRGPSYYRGFNKLLGCAVIDSIAGVNTGSVLLSHIPVHPNQRRRYRLNVHGHLHETAVTVAGSEVEQDNFYRCVSVEQCPNFAPINLADIVGERSVRFGGAY